MGPTTGQIGPTVACQQLLAFDAVLHWWLAPIDRVVSDLAEAPAFGAAVRVWKLLIEEPYSCRSHLDYLPRSAEGQAILAESKMLDFLIFFARFLIFDARCYEI